MAYCTHMPPCERQKGMIPVLSRPTSINPISAILNRPPFNSPATMAIFTQASRAARISAATYPTRAQLAAITRMQEQLAPILRVQNQLESISASKDALAMWADMLRIANDPVKRAIDTIKAVSDVQRHSIVKATCSPQMAAAIQPALWYLEQEHPDVYREIVPDELQRPAPGPSVRPQKNTPIRRRALDKANQLVIRSDITLMQFGDKLRQIPLKKLSLYLPVLSEIGDAAPDDIARSIHILVAVLMISLIISNKCHNHEHKPE